MVLCLPCCMLGFIHTLLFDKTPDYASEFSLFFVKDIFNDIFCFFIPSVLEFFLGNHSSLDGISLSGREHLCLFMSILHRNQLLQIGHV